MEARTATERELRDDRTGGLPAWLLGLAPLLLIVAAVIAFVALDGPGLGERRGPPVEQLAVEKTVLRPGTIEVTLRNDGPDAVTIAQAQVNDAFVQFSGADDPIGRLHSAKITLQQPWVEGEAYEVALVTSTGGTITHEIPVAVETPATDLSFFGLMALLGIYVGVIPIALGMLWLPWLRRIPPGWLRGLMALTVGLLAFLAIDATLEGFALAGEGSQAFGGAALVLIGAAVAFLALSGVSSWLEQRRRTAHAAGASAASSRCSSRSASACTTSARESRSARPTPSARWRSALSSSWASRCTTRPRGSRSSLRSRTCARRSAGSRCSG